MILPMTEGGFCWEVIRKYQDETAKPAPTIDFSRYDGGRVLLKGYQWALQLSG